MDREGEAVQASKENIVHGGWTRDKEALHESMLNFGYTACLSISGAKTLSILTHTETETHKREKCRG